MEDVLGLPVPAPTQALGWGAVAGEPQARPAALEEVLHHPPPTSCAEMTTGPGCHATDDMGVRLATRGGGTGLPGPCAKMDTRLAAAMEEQTRVAAAGQKPLHRLPPEPRHPLGASGAAGPRAPNAFELLENSVSQEPSV
ncbi:UNVERIFIED_CONTAM: hypothetical protein K2H54_059149 [Gekko kuhli]